MRVNKYAIITLSNFEKVIFYQRKSNLKRTENQ